MTRAVRIGLVFCMFALSGALAKEDPRSRTAPRPTGCEAFGPGFRKIEGSESCLKIGGSVRVESTYGSGGGGFAPSGSGFGK